MTMTGYPDREVHSRKSEKDGCIKSGTQWRVIKERFSEFGGAHYSPNVKRNFCVVSFAFFVVLGHSQI